MTDRSVPYSALWLIYKQSDQFKEQILHWLNLERHLPIYTPEMQIEVLEGAPMDIIKAHLKLIDPRARKKLGLEAQKTRSKTDEWIYNKFL